MSGGRRQSVTAQLQRTARRFSAAIVPQLTKLDPLPVLQKISGVHVAIHNFSTFETAQTQYVLHNSVHFSPIDFDIFPQGDRRPILSASLYPEELVVHEGQKRVVAVSLVEDEGERRIGSVKHPVSGMKLYDIFVNSDDQLRISSCVDEGEEWRLDAVPSGLLSLFFSCGCTHSRQSWSLRRLLTPVATISPHRSLFAENAVDVSLCPESDSESRLLALSLALVQLIREGFPAILHVIKEFNARQT